MLRLALVLLGAVFLIAALSIGSDDCAVYFIRSVGPPACAGAEIEVSRWEVLNPRYTNFWAGAGTATAAIGIVQVILHHVRRARRTQP